MKFSQIVLLFVVVLLLVFTLANLDALLFPHTINLFWLAFIRAPMGVILIIVLAVVMGIYHLAMSFNHLRAKAELAKYLKQMDEMRQSLDQQEASRFVQLQQHIDQQFKDLAGRMESRVDVLRNELLADIGQLDDKISRNDQLRKS